MEKRGKHRHTQVRDMGTEWQGDLRYIVRDGEGREREKLGLLEVL